MPHSCTQNALSRPGGRAGVPFPAMSERDDDPGADTGMFRAYVEHGAGAEARPSLVERPVVLIGGAVLVVLVVLALILLL